MVNFVTKFDNKSDNLGFFVPEEQPTLKSSLKVDQNIKDKVNKLLKTIDKNKDRKKIHSFDIGDNQKLFIIIIKKNLINFQLNNLGGSFRKFVSSDKNLKKISFLLSDNLKNEKISNEEVISEFLYGYTLKNYSFEKYKTKKKSNPSVIINICVDRTEKFNKEFKTLSFIKEGVFLTRDLISEPPNVLNPKNYTREILKLTKLGLKVEILNEKDLKTRFHKKDASDNGTNIDYFVIKKDNLSKVQKVTIFEKNIHFPEAVDHVYMTLEYDLKFEVIKNLNPSFIRLEKLKINKIFNLMNRRAKNLLLN